MVYVREAHPSDGWQMKVNEKEKVVYKDPKTEKARVEVATDCIKSLKISFPCILDGTDNKVQKTYLGFPARACLVGTDGKIIFISKQGPRGISAPDIEKVLKKNFK